VRLSVFEIPVSELSPRFGSVVGAVGIEVSIVTVSAVLFVDSFQERSVAVTWISCVASRSPLVGVRVYTQPLQTVEVLKIVSI
jgi:hypothetical protein